MFSKPIGANTELRLLELSHAEPLFALVDSCRSYLRPWLPWVDGTRAVSDTKAFIELTRKQLAEDNGFQAGIWLDGRIVGVIGFHKVDRKNRSTTIGYWLGETHQGKGLMTRACETLVDHAFKDLGLNRVEIRCATENKKSQAIPERLGFRKEGVSHDSEWLYDHFVDHVIYGMLARDWKIP